MSKRKIQATIKDYEAAVKALPEVHDQAQVDHVNELACSALTMIAQDAEKLERDEQMLAALMKTDGPKATTLELPEIGESHIQAAHLRNVVALRRAARATFSPTEA